MDNHGLYERGEPLGSLRSLFLPVTTRLSWGRHLSTSLALALLHIYAILRAAERYLRFRRRYPQVLTFFSNRWGGAWKILQKISFTCLAQRLLQDPVGAKHEKTIVRHIRIEGEPHHLAARCVITLFHSPWDGLLARWAASQNFALVLASEGAASLLGALYVKRDRAGLRRLICHLRRGGRVAIMVDSFASAGGYAAQFLNIPVRVPAGAIRLARLGRVPVVPLSMGYDRGCLRIQIGQRIPVEAGNTGELRATCAVLEFFDQAVREDPAGWIHLISFLKRWAVQADHSRKV